ncbi:MAG: hypothetical protein QY331_11020 [Melioribacteraceae bacterium]|nr:hypothetical protein [Melioribacteraceae bacterium]WKZ68484.1 MAG: hypothetical protein QY331_11020 [Melioribacteraceae bacterium]
MLETIVNIYLIIQKDFVTGFKALSYKQSGTDEEKIIFLKKSAKEDFESAILFEAPVDKKGQYMPYSRFAKLEKQGMHYRLFEEIFTEFNVPDKPLICVTPIVDGEFYGEEF